MDPREQDNVSIDFATADGTDFDLTIRPRPGKRVVKLTTTTTAALRDITGALFDMNRVVELCQEFLSDEESEAHELSPASQALWMTALVLYARCFNGGVRRPLDTSALDAIPGQSREAHQHFINLRDKFIGHSVNAYEQTPVFAVVDEKTSEVLRVGTIHALAIPMNKLGVETLKRLAHGFVETGELQRASLEMIVESEAKSLGREEVGRLLDLHLTPPSVARAGRQRKQ